MIIAPAVIFSSKYRKEISQNYGLVKIRIWTTVVLGTALWIALLSIVGLYVKNLLST